MDERLPGTEPREREQLICHVDMDCFYAACERRKEPALKREPLVVGMGYEDGETHGAVATASYEAREFGVESAMAISEALDLLPRRAEDDIETGVYRPVDMDYYESVAAEIRDILHETAETVREVSIDEAYLDVTDTVDWDAAREFGADLKRRISEEVGVPASVGIAPTMSAAKIASDHDKPDGLVVVEPGEVRAFLAPLDVAAVHNVGPVTASELREMDIETAGDIAGADVDRLTDRFGERGRDIWEYARGEDTREVEPVGKPKSLSRESAFTEATDDVERVQDRVTALASDVAERAARKDALYQTIGIKVVTPPFEIHTRADSLPGPVEDPDLVEEIALELLTEFESERVRKVGVRVSNLEFAAAEQASLDGFESPARNRSLAEFEDRSDSVEQSSLGDFE